MSDTKTQPPYRLSTGEILDSTPVPNTRVRQSGQSDIDTVLSVPLKKRWYMKRLFSWFMPFGTDRRVGLDRFGKEVWLLCDGTTRTEQIVEEFARRHRLTFHESRLSVMQFLRDLTRRGMIVMVGATGRETAL